MKQLSKWVLSVLLLLVLVLSVGKVDAGQVSELPTIKIVDRVGRSALLEAGSERILLLQGTPYQVGYAHGRLMAKDVAAVVDRILLVVRSADPKLNDDGSSDAMAEIYRRTLPYMPARYREELMGLAAGAGVDLRRLELANLLPEMFHCSGFALMGKATKGGKLIHGRVLDYMTDIGLQGHTVMIVSKLTGCNATMIPSYAGFVGCVTGLNDKQIAIGEMGMGGFGKWDGVPMSVLVRQALEDSDTLAQVFRTFRRSSRTCEYAYVVSDGKVPAAAAVYASWERLEIIRPGEAHRLLPKPVPDCVLLSAGKRYNLLVERVRSGYGKIDVEAAVEIIKHPVAMKSNLHNAIMLPEDSIVYLSNAVAVDQENFQACYQTYYKYEFRQFLSMLDKLAKDYQPTQPERVPLSRSLPAVGAKSTTQGAAR